jgi:hypothetical protein
MRRDDDVAPFGADQQLRRFRERVERVGVEHQRHSCALQQAAHELHRARCRPQPWARRDDVGLPREHVLERLQRHAALGPLDQRVGHVFRRHHGHQRLTRCRRRDGDQPGARLQRAHGRQVRRANLAAPASDHEHVAVVPLV